MEKLVSVIVPAYNASKYIKRCVNSALNQTYKNIEVIVINDGSRDDTLEKVKKIQEQDSRVIVFSKINEGVSIARNTGLKVSKGEFICFLDSDDYYKPTFIEAMINRLDENDSFDLATLINRTINKNNFKELDYVTAKDALDLLCQMKLPTSVWAYMYKREVISDIYFDSNINFFEDFLYNYRVLTKTRNIAFVKKDLYFYEVNPDGLNGTQFNERKLSSIRIVDTLLQNNEIRRSKFIFSAYSFFIVSNILFIAKSTENLNRYHVIIKQHSRRCLRHLNPLRISLTYYLLTLFSAISPTVTIKLIKIVYYKNYNKET